MNFRAGMGGPATGTSAEVIGRSARKFSIRTAIVDCRPAFLMAAVLMISGIFHLGRMVLSGQSWEGPVSFRKPGLFGISAGLTIWSVCWVLTKLHSRSGDRALANGTALLLLVEVSLITWQCWRGVPSHFNRSTLWDAIVEDCMLGLIVLVTGVIVWLTMRSIRLPEMHPADRVALRGGLWLLTCSCALGFLATGLGHINLAAGKPAEIWGDAGVLKFPHGAALHAIQYLPAVSWLAQRMKVRRAASVVRAVLWSQSLFLVYAIWQALSGRARWDVDRVGGALLATSLAMLLIPLLLIGTAWVRSIRRAVRT